MTNLRQPPSSTAFVNRLRQKRYGGQESTSAFIGFPPPRVRYGGTGRRNKPAPSSHDA
jgi:hypothetical protein